MSDLRVRPAIEEDLGNIAAIGSEAFSGLRPLEVGQRWVRACWSAFPRMQYWVAEDAGEVHGYILWMEKGGFRAEAVMELEQIAVSSDRRRSGVGAELVRVSLVDLKKALKERGSRLRLVEVTTGTEQHAVEFYRRTLGAEVVAKLPQVFRGDEYVLFARMDAA